MDVLRSLVSGLIAAANERQINRSVNSEAEAPMATPAIADETGWRGVALALLLTEILAGPIAIVATSAKSQTRDELAAVPPSPFAPWCSNACTD